MNRCDICTHEGNCIECMWYGGSRFRADNNILFKDLFVMSPSKATVKRLGGYISDKSKETISVTEFADRCRECGKMRTTTVTKYEDNEEWYCNFQICDTCKTEFICGTAKYCPGCGKRIVEKENK